MTIDFRLEEVILHLLAKRRRGASIGARDAARHVDEIGWRSLIEPTKMAARRLAAAGRLEITKDGRVVETSKASGDVEFRLPSRGSLEIEAQTP